MNRTRKALVGAAAIGASVLGGALGASMVSGTASAQTDSSSSSAPATAPPQNGQQGPHGPHQANGITEELLTGDNATQVTNAAKRAVPDGTIDRVETDADGATYEAHMTKSDGSHVTVKLDAGFNVTSVEDGMR